MTKHFIPRRVVVPDLQEVWTKKNSEIFGSGIPGVRTLHSVLGSFLDKIFGTLTNYAFSNRFLSIESHRLFKKIPAWYCLIVIFSKN